MRSSSTWKPRTQRYSGSRPASIAVSRACSLFPLFSYKCFCVSPTWRATKCWSITRLTRPDFASTLHRHTSCSSRGTSASTPNNTGMQTARRSHRRRYTSMAYHSSGASSRCSAFSRPGSCHVGGAQGARATAISRLNFALQAMGRMEETCWLLVRRWHHTHVSSNELLTAIHRRATGARCLAACERDTHLRAHRTSNGKPLAFCNVLVKSTLRDRRA